MTRPAITPSTISIIGAIAMLVVYGLWARQYLSSADPPSEEVEEPRLSARTAMILLALGGIGSAFVSDWFVHALEPTIHKLHISQAFAGLVIVAIAGNAVEHAVGVVLAYKGHAELAIAVVKNSVGQIAAFLYPLLVLASLLTATSLTFSLARGLHRRAVRHRGDHLADHLRRGGHGVRGRRAGSGVRDPRDRRGVRGLTGQHSRTERRGAAILRLRKNHI